MRLILLSFLLSSPICLYAQPSMLWDNPSFEDEPAHSRPPIGWYYCDEAGESPPDVHPGGFFGVTKAAHDGQTYLGLVTRDNGTTEGIGQRLFGLLSPGGCYELQFFAARSDEHQSASRSTGEFVKFDEPAKIRIWGGMSNCDKSGLLAQSEPVASTEWTRYTLQFEVPQAYTHINIEVAHLPSQAPYNGNVLLDQLSPLIPIDCESGRVLSNIEPSQLPELADAQALTQAIGRRLQQVQITAEGRLQEHTVALPSGGYVQANRFLWETGSLLRQFPNYKLQIGLVKKHSPAIMRQLQRQIWYSLQAGGYSNREQFHIKGRVNSKRWETAAALCYRLKG